MPGAREPKFPDGRAFYQTQIREYVTRDMSAREIHDFGLAEARAGLLPRASRMADEAAERFDSGEVDVTAVGRGAVEEDDFHGL